jgi:hypothetical protein
MSVSDDTMSFKRIITSVLLGLMLFWVYVGTAIDISGGGTTTYSGDVSGTLSGGGGTQTLSGGTGGGGGAGGGGGGGGTSGESYENIEVKEKYDL